MSIKLTNNTKLLLMPFIGLIMIPLTGEADVGITFFLAGLLAFFLNTKLKTDGKVFAAIGILALICVFLARKSMSGVPLDTSFLWITFKDIMTFFFMSAFLTLMFWSYKDINKERGGDDPA